MLSTSFDITTRILIRARSLGALRRTSDIFESYAYAGQEAEKLGKILGFQVKTFNYVQPGNQWYGKSGYLNFESFQMS